MLFIVGLPVVQILLFCYAIGHDPTGLKVAVANHEMTEEMIMQQFCPVHTGCNRTMLSCRYLDMLVKNKSMVVVSTCHANYLGAHPEGRGRCCRCWLLLKLCNASRATSTITTHVTIFLLLLLLLLLIEGRRDDGSTLPAIRVIYFNLCGQQSWSATVCMLLNLLHTASDRPWLVLPDS